MRVVECVSAKYAYLLLGFISSIFLAKFGGERMVSDGPGGLMDKL